MDFEYSNASVSECDRLQSVGLRKVSALNLDMGRFDFARDIFDGIFKNSIALKWLSPTGWSRSQHRSVIGALKMSSLAALGRCCTRTDTLRDRAAPEFAIRKSIVATAL